MTGARNTPSHAREHASGARSPRQGGARLPQQREDGRGGGLPHPEIECAEEAEYDAQDRLKQMDGVAYSYTDRGTLHHRAEGSLLETFTYDALGNLTRVERGGAPDIDYVIDAQGRRVGKREDGALSKQYVWGGALRVVAELDGDGDVTSRFVYGNGLTTPDLIVRKGAGSSADRLYRVISDHLGSPIYVVNLADPADVWLDASYDEWGNITSFKLDGVDQGDDTSAWPIPQGFAGGLYDADTGLVRFGVRDYDPRVGRWTAKDPILFEGGQGNLYVYVRNQPINLLDPLGLRVWDAAETAGLLGRYESNMNAAIAGGGEAWTLMAAVHGAGGYYDFWGRSETEGDFFQVEGVGILDAAEMGNFIAGYGARVAEGHASMSAPWLLFSKFGVHAAGSYFGILGTTGRGGAWEDLSWRNNGFFGDSFRSRDAINAGYNYKGSGAPCPKR